jgi:hypothetical protein
LFFIFLNGCAVDLLMAIYRRKDGQTASDPWTIYFNFSTNISDIIIMQPSIHIQPGMYFYLKFVCLMFYSIMIVQLLFCISGLIFMYVNVSKNCLDLSLEYISWFDWLKTLCLCIIYLLNPITTGLFERISPTDSFCIYLKYSFI